MEPGVKFICTIMSLPCIFCYNTLHVVILFVFLVFCYHGFRVAIFVLVLMLSHFHYGVWEPLSFYFDKALFMWDATENGHSEQAS